MEDIKRCTRCILPESLPSVKLDKDGVCNHCKTYDRLFGNWEDVKLQREKQFEDFLQRAKGLNRHYDCLVTLSGGKDSTYALYLCDKVYKLKCLCVTFDNGFLSEYAKRNIRNAIEATNADHIFYSINRHLMMKLYRIFLAKCGNFCPACMRGIAIVGQLADYYKAPIIISGAGTRVAYLAMIPELFEGGNLDFFKSVIKGESIYDNVSQLYIEPSLSWKMTRMVRLALKLLRVPNPILQQHPINLYDYIYTPFDKIRDILTSEMGWERPGDQFEHMDCLLHDIAFYIHTLKFPEVTNTTFYHSGLIRLGVMTREEALNIENNKLINPQIPQGLDSFLSEIGMSKDEFESSVSDWRNIDKFRSKKKNVVESVYMRLTGA